MRIGLILPGFSANESDWAIPVQLNLVRALAREHAVRVVALRYPPARQPYDVFGAAVYPLGAGQTRGLGRLRLWGEACVCCAACTGRPPSTCCTPCGPTKSGLLATWAGRWLGVPAWFPWPGASWSAWTRSVTVSSAGASAAGSWGRGCMARRG